MAVPQISTGTLQPQIASASLSDILTAAKNLVTALNNASNNYMSVQGLLNYPNITTATLVKSSSGRVSTVSIITAGSTVGAIYDAAALGVTSRPIVTIPNIVGVFSAPIPMSYGILVVPGTGQVVTVGYS